MTQKTYHVGGAYVFLHLIPASVRSEHCTCAPPVPLLELFLLTSCYVLPALLMSIA